MSLIIDRRKLAQDLRDYREKKFKEKYGETAQKGKNMLLSMREAGEPLNIRPMLWWKLENFHHVNDLNFLLVCKIIGRNPLEYLKEQQLLATIRPRKRKPRNITRG
jgi:hypothetical protein